MPELVAWDPTLKEGQAQAPQTQLSEAGTEGLSVRQVGVSRLDLQHPYLVLRGGSTAYFSLSHLEHTTLPEGELHWAAKGLVP